MKVFDIEHKFHDIVIAGTGKALPPLIFTNEDMVRWHGEKDPEWFYEKIGVRSRHSFYDYLNNRALDTDENELAVEASKRALENAGMTIRDIDAIFFTTSTPAFHIAPDSACALHGNLGASIDTPAMTVNGGCAGTLNCIVLAISLITAGQANNVLVCGASTMSSYFRPHLKDKIWFHSCIFGDGVATVIVSKQEKNKDPKKRKGFGSFFLGADKNADVAVKKMGASRYPIEPHNVEEALNDAVVIDFRAVPTNIVTKLDFVYKNILALTDVSPSKIDWFLLNQANAVHQGRWIVNTGFPVEKGFSNMVNLGNCAAASLGLTLHDFMETVKPEEGTLALVMAIGTGLQYGGALYRF